MIHHRIAIVAVSLACACVSCSEHHAAPPAPAKQTAAPAPAKAPEPVSAPAAPASTPAAPAPAAPAPAATTAATPPAAAASVTTIDEAVKKWFISVERAKELYDTKEYQGRQVIFIDARTFLEFRDDGHIRGAMYYPTAYTRGVPQPKVRNYLPGSCIVLYCHGELCTDSIEVGRYFESLKLDIGPVFIIKAGFPGWKAAYPNLVDKGNEVGFD